MKVLLLICLLHLLDKTFASSDQASDDQCVITPSEDDACADPSMKTNSSSNDQDYDYNVSGDEGGDDHYEDLNDLDGILDDLDQEISDIEAEIGEWGEDDDDDDEYEYEYGEDYDEEEMDEFEDESRGMEELYFEPFTVDQIRDDMFALLSDSVDEDFLWYRSPFGLDQKFEKESHGRSMKVLDEVKKYMMEQVLVQDEFIGVRDTCRMRSKFCVYWAVEGECEASIEYMSLHCAPACQSCKKLDINERCPWNPKDFPDAWSAPHDIKDGDEVNEANETESNENKNTLNSMFERIMADPWFQEKHQPVVHSKDPWVVTFENFLTDEECDSLIQAGTENGYERSEDVGEENFDGSYSSVTSAARTSSNTWCDKELGCYETPINQGVLEKIRNVTNIPISNNEELQLLRYDVGQFYGQHHDYIPQDADRQTGARILTVFLYLNNVEEGGGTRFPTLNGDEGLTIQPKRGRALLWPSVLHDSPNEIDVRTEHEALPVLKGRKYAANAWVHQRDFMQAFDSGCA